MEQAVQLLRLKAFRIGCILDTVKKQVAHGEFEKWIAKNTPLLPYRTAKWYHEYCIGIGQICSAADLEKLSDFDNNDPKQLPELPSLRSVTEGGKKQKRIGNDLTREEIQQFGNLVAPKEEKPTKEKPASPSPQTPPHEAWWTRLAAEMESAAEHLPKFHPKDQEIKRRQLETWVRSLSGIVVVDKRRKQ